MRTQLFWGIGLYICLTLLIDIVYMVAGRCLSSDEGRRYNIKGEGVVHQWKVGRDKKGIGLVNKAPELGQM